MHLPAPYLIILLSSLTLWLSLQLPTILPCSRPVINNKCTFSINPLSSILFSTTLSFFSVLSLRSPNPLIILWRSECKTLWSYVLICNAVYQRNLDDWSRKRWGDYWVLLNSHFNELYIAFYKLLLHREHLVRKSMPSIMFQGYISTGKHS
jgi:hypothetical protein